MEYIYTGIKAVHLQESFN